MDPMYQVSDREQENPSARPNEPTGELLSPRLFERGEMRVSDLVGGMPSSMNKAPLPVRPVLRRGGPLQLDWYDYAVVALILSSLIAGVACLIGGV